MTVEFPAAARFDYPLIRAVKAGFCSFKELKDGSLDMMDVWTMNDWADLSDHIESSLQKKMESEAKK